MKGAPINVSILTKRARQLSEFYLEAERNKPTKNQTTTKKDQQKQIQNN